MKINKILLGFVALSSLLLGACNDVMPGSTTQGFPTDTLSYTVAPGDTVTIDFAAESDWQLSSDAMWCKVDGLFLDTRGKSGNQSVSFIISDEGQTVDVSKASISLRLNDEIRVIAIVTRVGITDAMILGSDSINYTHGETLTIGTSATQALVIRKTTFDSNNLYISSNVDWLDITREDSVITLSVKPEYQKYSQYSTTDSICFSDRDNPMMRLNVQYVGMNAYDVILDPATQWDVRIAADGKTYKDAMFDMTGTVHEAPFTSVVTVRNDAYELYYAAYDKTTGCVLVGEDDLEWYTVEDDKKGHISVSFGENDGSKHIAYLFVLPQVVSDSLSAEGDKLANIADFLFEEVEDKAEVKFECEKYLIAEFVQENALAGCFSIQDGQDLNDVDFVRETDEQWLTIASARGVAADKVFRAELEFGLPYNVNPMLAISAWRPDVVGGAHIELWSKSGEQFKADYDYRAEPAMTEDDLYYYMQLQVYLEEEYIIYFVDDQGSYLKALVVEPIL